jgi:U32 family peptidase
VTKKPELMSPAGGLPQMRAAIEAGADAVYFGLEGFNARAKAMSFTHETLPDVMAELHERGVMGFVAVNTLVFDTELERLEDELLGIAAAGADAIIVQDVGVMQLARELAPKLALHASTQMTVTSAEGANFAQSLGAKRVVLARELSLKEIENIRQNTTVELEVFVHGALCVSYSGQCFSSEAWGGRSANRGACAQACRLPYELIVDGEMRDLGASRYLLSPQDLFALEQIPELVRIGVECFKIEGRYKDAEYVAATTDAYRKAIDAAWEGHVQPVSKLEKQNLEQVYSRGLLPAFMQGTNHQEVVIGRAPRHRGLKVGTVTRITMKGVRVWLEGITLKPGDGLVFDAADWRSPQEREEGGQVFEVLFKGNKLEDSSGMREVELRFGNGQIDLSRVREGDWVWRSHDAQQMREYREFTNAGDPVARRGLSWLVSGAEGEPLRLMARDERGREVEGFSDTPLQTASKRALNRESLAVELGKLGDTPFYLENIEVELEGDLFLPLSSLTKARRAVLEDLLAWRREPKKRELHPGQLRRFHTPIPKTAPTRDFELSVLVRKADQLEAAIATHPDEIVLDYLELYGLRPSVEKILEAGIRAVVASPRVLKPAEERIYKFLLDLGASAILVRSVGLLHTLLEHPNHPELHGDFSLNAANGITVNAFLEMGLSKLAPTHDLNAKQIIELTTFSDPSKLEVILHHHLPVFHTEHCVFCRFMSSGTDYTNCGHPCETHSIALRDERGLEHPVMADVGCRNTVFGASAQSGAVHLEAWRKAGIRRFRLEFVHETPEQVSGVIDAYRRALEGKITAKQLERELELHTPSGITQGSFVVPFSDLEMLPMN